MNKDIPLLFNNANYNKIINSQFNKNNSNNDVLFNLSILLGFLLIGGIFLLYRYNYKISEIEVINSENEKIEAEEENEIEENKIQENEKEIYKTDKLNENIKNIKIEDKIRHQNIKTEHLNNCYFKEDNIDNKFYSLV